MHITYRKILISDKVFFKVYFSNLIFCSKICKLIDILINNHSNENPVIPLNEYSMELGGFFFYSQKYLANIDREKHKKVWGILDYTQFC